jgi:hypothetical protein
MHPELIPSLPKPAISDYAKAVMEIEMAGKKFYESVGGDDANKGETFTEIENHSNYPIRVPISAYCLKLGYYLWNRMRDDELRAKGIPVDDAEIPPTQQHAQNPDANALNLDNLPKGATVHEDPATGNKYIDYSGDPRLIPADHPFRQMLLAKGVKLPAPYDAVEKPQPAQPQPQAPELRLTSTGPALAEAALNDTIVMLLSVFPPAKLKKTIDNLVKPKDKKKSTSRKEK